MSDKILHSALNALQEAVFILDQKRNVLYANNAANELFGKGFEGSDFVQVIRHPDCLKIINAVLNGQASAGKTIAIEHPIKTTFDVLVSNLASDAKTDTKILVSLKDISVLKEAEVFRSDFVANVSHELRSPLTAISGFIETLQGAAKNDDDARERFLDLMGGEAARMTRLIADLLSLSKIEANLHVRPTGSTDVITLIQRVEEVSKGQLETEKKSIKINVNCKNTNIVGNDDELIQVFQNLIENAIKYAAFKTSIRIDISSDNIVAGIKGSSIKVAISDQGDGIAKEHIARLTERFYRVDSHRARDKGGTGLGLAIVKHIISRHRGRLQIESEIGVGSTFTVYLPVEL